MNLVNRCVIHIYEIIYVINAAQCCILQKYNEVQQKQIPLGEASKEAEQTNK